MRCHAEMLGMARDDEMMRREPMPGSAARISDSDDARRPRISMMMADFGSILPFSAAGGCRDDITAFISSMQ